MASRRQVERQIGKNLAGCGVIGKEKSVDEN
jgi:hypothetical protein